MEYASLLRNECPKEWRRLAHRTLPVHGAYVAVSSVSWLPEELA